MSPGRKKNENPLITWSQLFSSQSWKYMLSPTSFVSASHSINCSAWHVQNSLGNKCCFKLKKLSFPTGTWSFWICLQMIVVITVTIFSHFSNGAAIIFSFLFFFCKSWLWIIKCGVFTSKYMFSHLLFVYLVHGLRNNYLSCAVHCFSAYPSPLQSKGAAASVP